MTVKRQPPAAIELHVEELILYGFASADRGRIAEAMQRELTRLLAAGGLASWMSGNGGAPVVDAGSFAMAPGTSPEAIGEQVARAVYGGPPGEPREV